MKSILKIFLITLSLLGTANAGHVRFSSSQVQLLDMARNAGQSIDMPETIQSILLVESSAGAGGRFGDGGKSIGVMQVRPETAHYVTRVYGGTEHISMYHYSAMLMIDQYNIEVGTLYFDRCMKIFGNWRRAVVCYNQGITGAKRLTDEEVNNHPYLQKVRKALRLVRGFRNEKIIS